MEYHRNPVVWATAGIIVVSLLIFVYLAQIKFSVCVPIETSEEFEKFDKTIAALDSVVDLSIKLSSTLVAIGAAVLVGFKLDLKLTPILQILALGATICFIESALYAVWWRISVAELWLNDCLALISHDRLASRYTAHFYFFMMGLAATGLIVIFAMLTRHSRTTP